MKHYLLPCLTGIMLTCINSTSHTQSSASSTKLNAKTSLEEIIPPPKRLDPKTNSGFVFRNDINTKAVRNFIMHYGDVSAVTWFQSNEGATAYFIMNGIYTKVAYDKNGDYECMFKYYYEDKLSREIRHEVKSQYHDFNICCVTEFNRNGKTIYDVKIEDKHSFKTIRITNGEMQMVEEFFKS